MSAALIAFGLRSLPAARPMPAAPPAGTSRQGSLRESLGFLLGVPLLLGICVTSLAAQGLDQGWSSVVLPVDVRAKLGSVLDLGCWRRCSPSALSPGHCCTVPWLTVGGGGRCSRFPERPRSRVISLMTAAGLMAAPFGGLVAGVFVGAAGLSTTLLVTAGVYLVVTLWPALSASWREMDPG